MATVGLADSGVEQASPGAGTERLPLALGLSQALGQQEPDHGLRAVLVDAATVGVDDSEIELGSGETLLGRATEPLQRLGGRSRRQ